MGPVNWLGLWTLTGKEIRRFLKVYFQTVLAPVVTTLLFLAIFERSVAVAIKQLQNPVARLLAMVILENFRVHAGTVFAIQLLGQHHDVIVAIVRANPSAHDPDHDDGLRVCHRSRCGRRRGSRRASRGTVARARSARQHARRNKRDHPSANNSTQM